MKKLRSRRHQSLTGPQRTALPHRATSVTRLLKPKRSFQLRSPRTWGTLVVTQTVCIGTRREMRPWRRRSAPHAPVSSQARQCYSKLEQMWNRTKHHESKAGKGAGPAGTRKLQEARPGKFTMSGRFAWRGVLADRASIPRSPSLPLEARAQEVIARILDPALCVQIGLPRQNTLFILDPLKKNRQSQTILVSDWSSF